ncbi:MAG: hypothetical protein MI920_23650 [Kiloniellales bacterium]|nr:hypothetical protein [Kiloniellales bacterium]
MRGLAFGLSLIGGLGLFAAPALASANSVSTETDNSIRALEGEAAAEIVFGPIQPGRAEISAKGLAQRGVVIPVEVN